jgi:cold shock protein
MGIISKLCSLFGGGKRSSGSEQVGVVKWFSHSKGYGFISPEDGSEDVFVHVSSVQRSGFKTLNKGQRIGYGLETKNGRVSAVDLRRS